MKTIVFVWQGIGGRYGVWRDGLWKAMKHIEELHHVVYCEPTAEINLHNPDVILYWEAPCTINGKDAENYKRILNYTQEKPCKKILLFAGGPIKPEWVEGFDLLLVESQINEEECERMEIPYARAFGVNEELFKPADQPKIWDGLIQATFAGWKRHELFADALGEKGLAVGRVQQHDLNGYNHCLNRKVKVMDEVHPELLPNLINSAYTVVNTSEFWGGGQRCTLEAMACNVPPIVMIDSPKNCEYVQESGFGVICQPNADVIREAISQAKETKWVTMGREYIESKWTSKHYAEAILKHL